MTDNTSDLSDDVVPEVPRHSPMDREFAPWHKVRKEFVRKRQWNRYIINYAKNVLTGRIQIEGESDWAVDVEPNGVPESIEVADPLRCLVIPGDDILDIRSLLRDTDDIKCYIRYLGFNEGHGSDHVGTRVHIAHNDMTSLNRIHNGSYIAHDQFQTVANPESQANRYVKEHGPFHVVNLDLCDSLLPTEFGDFTSYYKALHSISAYQMKEMRSPWLLFITTQIAPDEVDAAMFDKFCEPTKINLQSHSEFEASLSELLPVAALNAGTSDPIDCSQFSEKELIDLFGIAIGKALLSFCSTAGQRWKVSMLGSHIYTIYESRNVSMLSLAFQFDPITPPPQDVTGILSDPLPQPKPFNESELATKLVTVVQNISNIDDLLVADPDLRAQLMESSADLLESVGYNRVDYIQWVEDGEGASIG